MSTDSGDVFEQYLGTKPLQSIDSQVNIAANNTNQKPAAGAHETWMECFTTIPRLRLQIDNRPAYLRNVKNLPESRNHLRNRRSCIQRRLAYRAPRSQFDEDFNRLGLQANPRLGLQIDNRPAYLRTVKNLPESRNAFVPTRRTPNVFLPRLSLTVPEWEKEISREFARRSKTSRILANLFSLDTAHNLSSLLFKRTQSGTCIDNVITSVGVEEFILVSQSPLIGTVRPAKYTMLVNEPSWSKNEVMNLTYFLAFGHQVSYQPPSVPDILYAAENLAKRGKNNWSVNKRFESTSEVMQQVIDENPHLADDEMCEQLADAIIYKMSKKMNQMTISSRNFWA